MSSDPARRRPGRHDLRVNRDVAKIALAKTATEDNPLDGVEFPRLVEWTCHRVLASAGDPRAGEWLARAHTALQARAATITDAALRDGFLRNIPVHAQIVAAWAAAIPV